MAVSRVSAAIEVYPTRVSPVMPEAGLALLASYLLGATPTSHLVSRLFAKIDLRAHGSGNLGATNLYRVLGWKYAVPVALFDIAKGAIPVLVLAPRVSDSQLFALACGVAAILGHVFSLFVGFKGGKGVATAAGVMLGLTPLALAISATVWALLVLLTGYVSLGSIAAAAVLPVAVYLLERPATAELLWIDIAVAAGVIFLHRRNIHRLLKGTENRFGRHARAATTPPR
jgi:glycerol-3-phosphate acyltransferase PlsY